MAFIQENFLLGNRTARQLYHKFAETEPIFDYHCHLPPKEIADDHRFENLTQIWLYGDHYKWRGMRADGVDEKYVTGKASDWEKFQKWAAAFILKREWSAPSARLPARSVLAAGTPPRA